MCVQNSKFIVLSVHRIIAKFLVAVAHPNLREEDGTGSGMVLLERALVSSYRASIVTFHLFLRVSEILPFMLQYATFPTTPVL